MTDTLLEEQCTFLIISRSFILRMRNVSDRSCRGIQTHILNSVTFLENRTVYEIMWKKYCRAGQATVWRMRIACWIPKATNTHSKYVILIAFTRQQWLRERFSVLHLYVHCFIKHIR
jgi:hypothetical protein